jgi:hypothetical protein
MSMKLNKISSDTFSEIINYMHRFQIIPSSISYIHNYMERIGPAGTI